MKLLLIHADKFSFEAKKKTKVAEEIPEDQLTGDVSEVLVAFTAVEKKDASDENSSVELAVAEIISVAEQVKAERLVVYPYAHLSSELSSPSVAVRVLKAVQDALRDAGWETHRAPFGWYKAFDVACKGHPLSELSRDITPGMAVNKAVENEKKLVSQWYILGTDGELVPGKKYNFEKGNGLHKFFSYERAGVRKGGGSPPHIQIMQSHELVDYEEGSDSGHFRYYPKGRMMKALIEEKVNRKMQDYGAMEVETPIAYDYEHPSLKKYLERFPARQYTIETPQKRVFLRFAACFGQFLMAHDATISYRHLPLRLYEMTRYSFRVEQRGELSGLRRLRAFTMPDSHAICADVPQAKVELLERFRIAKDLQEEMGFDVDKELELAIRVTKPFWEENKEYVTSLVKEWGKPAIVEMWDDQFFYFIMKYEFNFIDSTNKAAALTTDQIDVENAKNYDITYVDSDGKDQHPVILHLSPSGAVERVIYAFLERESQKERPEMPLWLSPTQVRIIPVSENLREDCINMAKDMSVRVDVDDRDASLGKKIRTASKAWINYIVVYGDKEKESGKLTVTVRSTGEKEEMTVEELEQRIQGQLEGYPYRPLPVPMLLSKRISFR